MGNGKTQAATIEDRDLSDLKKQINDILRVFGALLFFLPIVFVGTAYGIRAGVIGIRVYRPFPRAEVREAFRKAPAIVVFEKDISYGYEGALSADIKAALYGIGIQTPVHNYIAGLGGRDVKANELAEAVRSSLAAIASGTREQQTWLNCVTE